MPAGDLNIALVLKLIDQVSAPARKVERALGNIGDLTERTGRQGVEWANQQLAANEARRSALHSEALGMAAFGGSLIALMEPAIQAERRLAEVSKVVDFESPDGFAILNKDIRELVTSGGLAATAAGMTDIIAAAGRMGVVDENLPDAEKRAALLEFATDAAKMSAAFGISADAAGTTLARWRENLKLTQDEAMALGDVVNLLGNTMATNEADILEVINRQGVVAKGAGLASNEIAALSATLLAAGSAPEIAATGLKNFTNALGKGEAVTARQGDVYRALGFDPEQISKDMQTSAKDTILKVLDAFQEVPDHKRNAMVGILFGEEAKGAIMPLIDNVEQLSKAFEKTADTSQLLGLMEDEYQRQAATTFAQRQRLIEYAKGLSVVIGTALLPQLNELMETIMPIVGAITDWAEVHPELINGLFKAAAGLFAFKLSSIALRWTLFALLPVVLHTIRAASGLMILGPQLARGILALLTPVKLVQGALVALRFAFLSTGIGALLAGVAMAGVWIYNNWSGLQAFFVGFWEGFRASLGPAAPLLDGIADAAARLWQWIVDLTGPLNASREEWSAWGNGAGAAVGELLGKLSDWGGLNLQLVGSLAALYAGFAALRLIWWLPLSPLVAAGKILSWLAKGPLVWLLKGVRLIGVAFARLGALALANPIGVILAAVAGLAYAVYDNWDKVVSYLMDKVDAVKAAFDQGLIQGVFKLLAEFNPFTLAMEGAIGLVAYVMELLGVPEQIISTFKEYSLFVTGVDLMKSLWDGMGSIVDQAVGFIVEKFKALKPQWLTDLQNWIGSDGGGAGPAAAAAKTDWQPQRWRDNGGPVVPGFGYLVGEREPEVFVPNVPGTVHPTRAIRAALAAASVAGSAGAAAAAPVEIHERIDQRPTLSAQAPAPQVTREGDTIHIHITPPAGTSEEMIAQAVARELRRRENERRADLHDGVDF